MAGKNIQFSTGSLFTTWLLVAILILCLPPEHTGKAVFFFQKTCGPALEWSRKVQLSILPTPATEQTATQAEYDHLKKDFNNMHAELLQLHREYETLTQMRSDLPQPFSDNLQLARVAGSLGNLSHKIMINKGDDANIKAGQYVLSAGKNNIVGIVEETRGQLSRVRLLTDAGQKIPVQIRRVGVAKDIGGLMVGSGKTTCRISNIDVQRDVQVGDLVFARSHPGLLNTPVIIGEVSNAVPDEKHPLLWDITVKPVEDLTRLDTVAVIVVEDF